MIVISENIVSFPGVSSAASVEKTANEPDKKYHGAGASHLPQSSRAGWSPQAKSPFGAVQAAQWRELDLSSSRATEEFPM